MKGKFSFLSVNICFDVTKCKFIVKYSSFKMLLVFLPIFVADTKITSVYYFVPPLMSKFSWKSNPEHKLRIFKLVILNTKWKECISRENLHTKNFTYTEKILYTRNYRRRFIKNLLPKKNTKKTCKPNNRDLHRDWIN